MSSIHFVWTKFILKIADETSQRKGSQCDFESFSYNRPFISVEIITIVLDNYCEALPAPSSLSRFQSGNEFHWHLWCKNNKNAQRNHCRIISTKFSTEFHLLHAYYGYEHMINNTHIHTVELEIFVENKMISYNLWQFIFRSFVMVDYCGFYGGKNGGCSAM